ncbi:MAG: hypothetical protein MZW92_37750 [Comamonadaceae bacterium]|nr:hypothetical protein [Comamonadaceae bacterium]
MAQRKSGALPAAPEGRLRVCPPRHLRPGGSAGDTDCALVLPPGPLHLQSAAGSSGGALSGDVGADRRGGGRGGARAASLEAAANTLRTDDVSLATALRWIRRRVHLVRINLIAVVSLLPDLFLGTAPSIHAFRLLLGAESALVALRAITASHLAALSRPLGLRPPQGAGGGRKQRRQQRKGPDPPAGRA